VWQKIAKEIAISFINIDKHVSVVLKKKYKNSQEKRRRNGAKQLLKHEFLLNDQKASEIIDQLWAG
jgi:L-2-hydroxyglutarate oxidase LhgO